MLKSLFLDVLSLQFFAKLIQRSCFTSINFATASWSSGNSRRMPV